MEERLLRKVITYNKHLNLEIRFDVQIRHKTLIHKNYMDELMLMHKFIKVLRPNLNQFAHDLLRFAAVPWRREREAPRHILDVESEIY